MKCASCGDDAILLINKSCFMQFALCKKCAKKRFIKGKHWIYGDSIEDEDLWDEIREGSCD